MTMTRAGNRTRTTVDVVQEGRARTRSDYVATEEPLEMRLAAGGAIRTIGVTMRTPGADFELAAGFLYGEGIVSSRDDVARVSYCVDPEIDAEQRYNIVNVDLTLPELPELPALERHFYTSSACGVCGKAALESLHLRHEPLPPGPAVPVETLYSLPDKLRGSQGIFDTTGGLHACGLFDLDGELLCLREDVGRHNAVDKVVGWALMNDALPLSDRIVMVSGRSSYEIVQKSLAAGAPIVCAVSAPSSLAVSVADEFNMTLVGFLRDNRCNVYTGADRVGTTDHTEAALRS
jgi:FdhD protein